VVVQFQWEEEGEGGRKEGQCSERLEELPSSGEEAVGRQVVKTQWVGSVEEGRGEQGGREGEDVWAEAE
jgi:hypothetical protein